MFDMLFRPTLLFFLLMGAILDTGDEGADSDCVIVFSAIGSGCVVVIVVVVVVAIVVGVSVPMGGSCCGKEGDRGEGGENGSKSATVTTLECAGKHSYEVFTCNKSQEDIKMARRPYCDIISQASNDGDVICSRG